MALQTIELSGPRPSLDDQARAALDGQTPAVRNVGGRPRIVYTPELGEIIVDLVADGSNFRKIGKMDGMPSRNTLHRWCRENQEFAHDYAMAQRDRADERVEQMIEVALNGSEDYQPKIVGETLSLTPCKEMVARSTLGVDTLKYVIQNERPDKFAPFEHRKELLALPAPNNGDNAKDITGQATVINHPLQEAMDAWEKAAKGGGA